MEGQTRMKLIENWTLSYTQHDSFIAMSSKRNLVYLLTKYGINKDGNPPTKKELLKLHRKQLYCVWKKIQPFEFGSDSTL